MRGTLRRSSLVVVSFLVAMTSAPAAVAGPPRIVFERGGDLFTVLPDGSGQRRITVTDASEHDPSWSPDRQRVAFIVGNRRVVVADADGGSRRTLFTLPSRFDSVDFVTWSPNGRRIAFSTTRMTGPLLQTRDCGQIWWMWADGRHPHRIVWHQPHVTGLSWSPEGRRLAVGFEHQNMTVACGDDRPLGIAVVRSDGTRLRGLGVPYGTNPDWSPDGRWIAYRDWRRTCHICGEVWLIHPDGSGNHVLLPISAQEGAYHMPRYSPAGTRIAVIGDGLELFRASDASHLRTVARGGVMSLDW